LVLPKEQTFVTKPILSSGTITSPKNILKWIYTNNEITATKFLPSTYLFYFTFLISLFRDKFIRWS
jgi:hypothetical protein